ncbi:MAG TPA: 4Fe-4S dicluster domain-containing protein [Longimicrobiales bacterium]
MMNRRNMLKTMGVAGAALLPKRAHAGEAAAGETVGILVDTTRCVGCRTCESACYDANREMGITYDENVDFSAPRRTDDKRLTVINRYDTAQGEVFVKSSCMHCLQPACASACLTRAMHKTTEVKGPVAWDGDKCMGCRYCMLSCPFDMPKFEYFSANPRIQKCTMCWEKLGQGEQPACVAHCPADALLFGERTKLLHEARSRIYNEPDRYISQIYGEHEAGGTNVLYLAGVPFDQLGFPKRIANESYPAMTREFLYAVPVVITLVPPLMVALRRASIARQDAEAEHTEGA